MNISSLVKKMKTKISGSFGSSQLLHSKPMLYIVLALVLVNLFANMVAGNYRYISSLFLIGFLISQFTKNMTTILLFALLLSNIIVLLWKGRIEGFEGGDGDKKEDANADADTKKETTSGGGEDDVSAEVKNNSEVKKLIDDKGKLVEMKKDAEDLLNTQKQILDGLNKIEPLLTRAEVLSEKFSNMKSTGNK